MLDKTISLHISSSAFPVPPIGVDITLLLAASSFISGFDGKTDPRSAEAFVAVATAYCNGSDLILPLPRQTVEEIPIFLELWRRRAAMTPMPDVELSDDVFNTIGTSAAHEFATYAEGAAWDVGRWLAFQFTPSIANVYLQRSDISAIKRCSVIARTVLKDGELAQVQTVIAKLQQNDSIQIPGIYEHLIGTNDIPSFVHLCAAYAISVSLRGYSYAISLGQYPNAPLYRHHWVRAPIVRRIGSKDLPGEVKSEDIIHFPWGPILRRVFDPSAPVAGRDPEHVAMVLDGLRDRSVRMTDAMQQGLLNNLVSKQAGDKLTEAEGFVLKMLLEVGVAPRYAESTFLQQGVRWLREISKEKALFRLPVELITTNLQPRWLRGVESTMRLRFKRDSFWKAMEDPGIRAAIREVP
jgi:hypothetical protein